MHPDVALAHKTFQRQQYAFRVALDQIRSVRRICGIFFGLYLYGVVYSVLERDWWEVVSRVAIATALGVRIWASRGQRRRLVGRMITDG